jgi:hypothetical protein
VPDEDGHLRRPEQDEAGAEQTVYDRETRVGWSRRMRSKFISLLPLEKYLQCAIQESTVAMEN